MFKIQIKCDTDDLKFNGNLIDKRQYNNIRSRL